MGTPYLCEIRIVSFYYAPRGWAFCNGQFLPINQNQALFSLLGTTYGGNGQTTFALPDLRGRVPLHVGAGFVLGQTGGQQAHTVTLAEMPAHNHLVTGSNAAASSPTPGGNLWANGNQPAYTASGSYAALNSATVSNTGGSQQHENMPPYLVLNFCIALQGVFPFQN